MSTAPKNNGTISFSGIVVLSNVRIPSNDPILSGTKVADARIYVNDAVLMGGLARWFVKGKLETLGYAKVATYFAYGTVRTLFSAGC